MTDRKKPPIQMIRELAGEILWHLGYKVEFAQDGDEAVALYKTALKTARAFDAVIPDLTVRGGKKTIQKLIEIDPDVKGIVSSDYSDDPGMTDFQQYGFSGVVAKPYILKELGGEIEPGVEKLTPLDTGYSMFDTGCSILDTRCLAKGASGCGQTPKRNTIH